MKTQWSTKEVREVLENYGHCFIKKTSEFDGSAFSQKAESFGFTYNKTTGLWEKESASFT